MAHSRFSLANAAPENQEFVHLIEGVGGTGRQPLNKFPHVSRETIPRSSSREVRIRVSFFSVVYFSRGTLPPKTGKRALLGNLDTGGGCHQTNFQPSSCARCMRCPGPALKESRRCRERAAMNAENSVYAPKPMYMGAREHAA